MVLEKNIPSEVDRKDVIEMYKDRFPNYCHKCGNEVVIAGGRISPEHGIYEHIDPVLTCEKACWQDRFTAGIDQEEGQQYWVSHGGEEWHKEFDNIIGFCDIHKKEMKVTKDLLIQGEKIRQHKCPECDRENTVKYSP